MKTNYNKANYLFLFLCAIICACSPAKHLSEQSYLLSKNEVVCNSKLIEKSDLKNLIRQDPNGRFLGVKWAMYFYSMSEKGEDSTVNYISRNVFRKLGSKPVAIDDKLTKRSVKEMQTFLQSKGAFNASVKDTLEPVRRWYAPWSYYKKRRKVVYRVDIPNRYTINSFSLLTSDTSINKIATEHINNSEIKKGNYYDEEKLSKLRSTLYNDLREKGYYAFSEKYISFLVDTNLNSNSLNIEMNISNPYTKVNDSLIEGVHKLYKLRDIFVYPDYYPPTSALYTPPKDTIRIHHKQGRNAVLSNYYFIRSDKNSLKAKPIMRSILLQKGRLYSTESAKNTFTALSQLKNFKYIDISFIPDNSSTADTLPLDCLIKLSMSKPVNLLTSFEFNFSAANNSVNTQNTSSLGSEINIGFSHSNLLKGAEIFSTNIKAAAEVRSDIFKNYDKLDKWNMFNAFELGFDMGIELPRFLIPFSTHFYSMRFRPHTSIKLAYNTQKRTYYDRNISTVNYEYTWRTKPTNNFSFIPLEVNFVDIEITDDNYKNMLSSLDKRIQYQMTDHMVMAARFGFIYNGQNVGSKQDFTYLRANLESAGNLLFLISNLSKQQKNDHNEYEFISVPYSQYIRTDFDLVHYMYLDKKDVLVARVFGGMGYFYGNSKSLPYEKSFFGGGANNNRAWQLRELGPGSSKPYGQLQYDRAGDIALGFNLEYRFPIGGVFEGAAFIDAGNIWTLSEQKGLEGGQFKFNKFYKEIAVGGGLGLRINIEFLIIRFDLAMKLRDPSQEEGSRWVIRHATSKDLQLQFGIGYPF